MKEPGELRRSRNGFFAESALRVIPQQAQRDLCLTLGGKFKEWFPTLLENP